MDIREIERKLGERASKVWKQTVKQFPMTIIKDEGGLDFSGPDLPTEMWKDLSELNMATGHLTHLVASYKKIKQEIKKIENIEPNPDPSLPAQQKLVFDIFMFISHNEYWLDRNEDLSLTYLADLVDIENRLLPYKQKDAIPSQTTELILSLASDAEIQKILQEKDSLFEKESRHFDHMQQLEEKLDPNSKKQKNERCLGPTADLYEIFPSHSSLKERLAHIAAEIESQLDSMETEAKTHHGEFVDSLPSGTDREQLSPGDFYREHPEYVESIVHLKSGSIDWSEQNQWTIPFFERLSHESNSEKHSDILSKIHSSCSTMKLMRTTKEWASEKSSEKLENLSYKPKDIGDGELVLALHRRVQKSRVLFELRHTKNEEIVGIIYVSSGGTKPVSLSAICLSLGGFCREPSLQAHESPKQYLELDLPSGGSFPRTLNVSVKPVNQKVFLGHLLRLEFKSTSFN